MTPLIVFVLVWLVSALVAAFIVGKYLGGN